MQRHRNFTQPELQHPPQVRVTCVYALIYKLPRALFTSANVTVKPRAPCWRAELRRTMETYTELATASNREEEAGNVETLPTLCRRLIPGGRRPREPRANIALGLAGFDARPPP